MEIVFKEGAFSIKKNSGRNLTNSSRPKLNLVKPSRKLKKLEIESKIKIYWRARLGALFVISSLLVYFHGDFLDMARLLNMPGEFSGYALTVAHYLQNNY